MRSPLRFLPSLIFFTCLLPGTNLLRAQTASGRLAYLSQDDKIHLLKVRRQVLASNQDLKAEQESLQKERQFVKDNGTAATSEDRKTLRGNALAHGEKMQAAMRQADPSLAPVLGQVNAHLQQTS